jgi:hypothetical protein
MQVNEIKNGRLREQIVYSKNIEKICQSQLWPIIIYIWKTFKHRSHFTGLKIQKQEHHLIFFKEA